MLFLATVLTNKSAIVLFLQCINAKAIALTYQLMFDIHRSDSTSEFTSKYIPNGSVIFQMVIFSFM